MIQTIVGLVITLFIICILWLIGRISYHFKGVTSHDLWDNVIYGTLMLVFGIVGFWVLVLIVYLLYLFGGYIIHLL